MTDSSTLIPNAMGIPAECKYDLKHSAVRSRSYRSSVVPTNKSVFNPSDTAICYVSGGRRNTFLDQSQSYVRFTIKNNDTTASTSTGSQALFNIDNNASCVINRLDIFHASNLIETVQNYNQLMTIFMDTNMNSAQRTGLSAAYGTATDGTRQGLPLYGTVWNTTTTAASNTSAQQQTFCMPIISGTIGLGSESYLPLGKLNDDIRCEFTFETANAGVVYNSSTYTSAWTIVDFQLELCIVELSDEGQAMVDSYTSPEMPIYIHGNSWRSFTSNLPSGTSGGVSYLVPARFGSLKTIYVCCRRARETSGTTQATSYTISSRINPNFASYWWRVGSALLPAKYVVLEGNSTGGYGEGFMELQKTFHSVSSPENASILPASIYNVGDAATTSFSALLTVPTLYTTGVSAPSTDSASYKNGFLIGQELESFALRSDVLLSGYNTLSQQVFFEAQINTTTLAAYTLNFFAGFDQILCIENGIMSVRF
jgi:hypothetical protein